MEVEDVVLVRAEVVVEEMYLVRNGAGNNESCFMEEGQIYDFDERNLSDQNVSSDIKASCDSIVEEYGNFRVNCGSKQAIWGSSCKLSEDDSMDAALIAQNGAGVSLGKACEVHALRREVGEDFL